MSIKSSLVLLLIQVIVLRVSCSIDTDRFKNQANNLKYNSNPQTPSEVEEYQISKAFEMAVATDDEDNIDHYGSLYNDYVNGKAELQQQLTKISQRADQLIQNSTTPEDIKPILQHIKTTADSQKNYAKSDQLRLVVQNLLELLWEAALESKPNSTLSTVSPGPQDPTNISHSADYQSCLYILQQLQAQHKIPVTPTANNFLANLSKSDLRQLKRKLDNLKSDRDIFDTFFSFLPC